MDTVLTRLVPISEDQQPQWDQKATLPERMEFYKVPGVGIAVIDDFKLVWVGGYGKVRAGGDELVDTGTLFHAGSVAKPVSTAAVLTLVEAGKLQLDASVNDVLASWNIPENEFTRQEKVTLRHLLSHSGGIEDGFTNRSSGDAVPNYFTPQGTTPSVKLTELLDAKSGVDVDGPTRVTAVPGSRYRYANADYVIVELLVGDIMDAPFSTFMQTTVLDPLGMSSSTYDQPLPESLRSRAAVEHDIEGKALAGDRLHIPLLAAGGLWTTPSDLAQFTIEIMNAHRGASERLLSRAMVQEMLAPQISIEGNPLADAMALGFERSGSDTDLVILHTGGTWGSTAVLFAYPERGQGVVIMTNSATGSLLRFEILIAIAIEYGWPMLG
jgi:CubicO group peptidase (beta-lactamase class C family)